MTRDEIIRMAMDVGLMDKVDNSDDYFIRADAFDDEIVRFAELVAAAERERCAEVCCTLERMKWEVFRNGGRLAGVSPADCAVAIRGVK